MADHNAADIAPTIGAWLVEAKRRFAAISSSPALDAQLLMAAVLNVSRAHVIAHPEKALTEAQMAQFAAWAARRAEGEPLAYLLGRKAFYDREFIVTADVLIPRPETEHLLEAALGFVHGKAGISAVDVGTGSGALAVTLAAHAPHCTVYATDISPAALAVAQQNAALNHVNITFLQGDLLLPLGARRVDLVMANLPYIATTVMHGLPVAQHEPHLALDGGADGLDVIRRLLAQVPDYCNPGAFILLEIGADQGEAVVALGQALSPSVMLMQDYAGLDRLVAITLP
ncbi:MAG: peptide chain release factor N(5)-glutamine methyltransferase [Anaerolineae bacterium]